MRATKNSLQLSYDTNLITKFKFESNKIVNSINNVIKI